ncbi:cytochrome c peroxidase [Bacillaceae bacterium IKA-2]|nr:cytochrome c peroxidase [Bacillaceae bacterium IKA-2]
MKKLYFCFLIAIASLIGCSSSGEKNVSLANSTTQISDDQMEVSSEFDEAVKTLMSNGTLVPLGGVPIPEDSPMTEEVLELGQILFFDPRLSGNNEVSCATCHDPELGYGDARATFETITGEDGARNSQTIINSGYYTSFFWDGRAASLEEQALGPIEDPHEMNQPLDELIDKLKEIEGYEDLFLAAFDDGITVDNIGKSLAAFQRLIVVNNTPFDRYLEGDKDALSIEETRGLELFVGKAFCSTCHNGENLSDNEFYNTGLLTEDKGRYNVTEVEGDIGRFRTPSLYGITHTGPYMHNGNFETLEEVIEFYNRGGDGHPNTSIFMDMFMSEINLSAEEKAELLAFLKVLGGEVPMFEKPSLP